MTEEELKFATHHQAAHVAVAVMMGCGVDSVSPIGSAAEEDWGVLGSPIEDVATVCGAGFAIERILGRPTEEAWARCKNDRALLAAIYADRTGIALEDHDLTELFYRGVEYSQSILNHPNVIKVTESLAGALRKRHDDGGMSLLGSEVRELVEPMSGTLTRLAQAV